MTLPPITRLCNFYPRPPQGGRLEDLYGHDRWMAISIHALRKEGDETGGVRSVRTAGNFYPRPPQGGRHGPCKDALDKLEFLSTPSARRATEAVGISEGAFSIFLSTPSARRATYPDCRRLQLPCDFYPRPPQGGRPVPCVVADDLSEISIHALRKEGDIMDRQLFFDAAGFLSTPSARRATSTSASHAGSGVNFYPRPPQGGRLLCDAEQCRRAEFLSTPSARRATREPMALVMVKNLFLSTPSARRATHFSRPDVGPLRISIHALRKEGDFSSATA